MATIPEGGHRNNFSIIVKENKDHAILQVSNDKMAGTTAVKYTKSTHSIGSRDRVTDVKLGEIVESSSATGKDASMPPLKDKANGVDAITVKKKLPRVKKRSQVGVDNGQISARDFEEVPSSLRMTPSPTQSVRGQELSGTSVKFIPETRGGSRVAKQDRKFKQKRHSLWYRLRRRHMHMGVVEVNMCHPFYTRLQALSAGMKSVFTDPVKLGPLENLHTSDYNLVQRKELTFKEEKTFLFENYAPAVFATIRRAVAVEEHAYMESMISHHLDYLEFFSNSRSGQDFFLSANMQYLIKTNKKRDIEYLMTMLNDYLQHFLAFPHSLLVKYVGCYSVKLPGKKKIFFLVMQNIFYPAERIEDRFDVKGCTAGRYQQPYPPGSQNITVLKDQNFFHEELQLGVNSEWFVKQISADAMFLRDLNVMDYSLLVGRQKLQKTEQECYYLPDLVSRITKSRQGGSSQGSVISQEETTISTSQSYSSLRRLPGKAPRLCLSKSASAATGKGLHFPHSLTDVPESSNFRHRRLLLDKSNALHIVDGPEYRYFFGVVDFLTCWTLKQKAARLWKVVKYGCGEHSTMPPHYYCERFVSFITSRVT